MTQVLSRGYHIDPTYLAGIVDSFIADSGHPETFASRCRKVAPLLAKTMRLDILGTIPNNGPLVVIENHPCHFDALLPGGTLFEARPDLRLLAKSSPLTTLLPSENTLLLRKDGMRGHPDDIKNLQTHLRDGGSILVAPWGCLDHRARNNVSLERAIQNVVRYASFAAATVLPITIEAEWSDKYKTELPLEAASITIHEPSLARWTAQISAQSPQSSLPCTNATLPKPRFCQKRRLSLP